MTLRSKTVMIQTAGFVAKEPWGKTRRNWDLSLVDAMTQLKSLQPLGLLFKHIGTRERVWELLCCSLYAQPPRVSATLSNSRSAVDGSPSIVVRVYFETCRGTTLTGCTRLCPCWILKIHFLLLGNWDSLRLAADIGSQPKLNMHEGDQNSSAGAVSLADALLDQVTTMSRTRNKMYIKHHLYGLSSLSIIWIFPQRACRFYYYFFTAHHKSALIVFPGAIDSLLYIYTLIIKI